MLSRRLFTQSLLGASAAAAAKPRQLTNVVFFLTDDHGAWATHSQGCGDLKTPNLDRLAREGSVFTNAFAATPVCSPSRATWLTGMMPSSHGIQDWLRPEDSFGPDSRDWLAGKQTVTEVLADAGYKLGMCGKWHLGRDEHPHAGFTYWATVPGGGGPYQNVQFVHNGERKLKPGFKEDALTDFALDFINQNHTRPFFLYVPFYAPHTPYNFQPEMDQDHYAGSKFSCFPDVPVHPWQNSGLRSHHGNRDSKLAYSALITSADRNIGRVLARLDELGLTDNTLVIFSADQGWNAGHHGVWGKGNGTIPLNMYEESIRVPLFWRHPGRIRAGRSLSPMVSSYDFFPTLLDYLGVPAAKSDARRVGRSYAGFLRDRAPKRWRDRLYFEYAYMRGVRTATHKYIERANPQPVELFNLAADPGERTNVLELSNETPSLTALRRDLHGFFTGIGAPPLAEWRTTTSQKIPANTI